MKPMHVAKFVWMLLGLFSGAKHVDGACNMPTSYWGDYYSADAGTETSTTINLNGLINNNLKNAVCIDVLPDNSTIDSKGNYDSHVLLYDAPSNCYLCFQFYYRTPNILQYKITTCYTSAVSKGPPTLDLVCSGILPQTDLLTMFRTTIAVVNCKQSFEGVYQFTYEWLMGGGGICNSSASVLTACQEPGSPYVDNQVLTMDFAICPEVTSSSNRDFRFQCMGRWVDENQNVYVTFADLGQVVNRQRFRCLLTRDDQQMDNNQKRYSMSQFATCNTLFSPYDGDIRLIFTPVISSAQYMVPTCNLPMNFSGTWFTTNQFDTHVIINATHIYFNTKIDQYTYKETYFTCIQTIDSRYLMSAVIVGRCETDYVCFDFMPRHQNIVRWRMGRPYRITRDVLTLPNYIFQVFYTACTWSSFTIDRNDVAWKYNTFLLNPPAPSDCPVGGRYSFEQYGDPGEMYITRLPLGATERPRHNIDCFDYTNQFWSCDSNQQVLQVEARYCATVDHTGRPIGEYDVPDRTLTCVGYWMEDMQSYMITYDELDAVSHFRCWVYTRLQWRQLMMSRSLRAVCGVTQTASSSAMSDGASLLLVLHESERLYDMCPQRYDTGQNPYNYLEQEFVLQRASASAVLNVVGFLILIFISFVLH